MFLPGRGKHSLTMGTAFNRQYEISDGVEAASNTKRTSVIIISISKDAGLLEKRKLRNSS
jgi:hypothetical protein